MSSSPPARFCRPSKKGLIGRNRRVAPVKPPRSPLPVALGTTKSSLPVFSPRQAFEKQCFPNTKCSSGNLSYLHHLRRRISEGISEQAVRVNKH